VFPVCIIWAESSEWRLQHWMSWGDYNETWKSNDRGLFEWHYIPVITCGLEPRNTGIIVRRQLFVTHWSHLFHLGHDVNRQGLTLGVSFEETVHLRISFGYMSVAVLQCVQKNNDFYSELFLWAYTYVFQCIYVDPLCECMLVGRSYVYTHSKPSPFRFHLIRIEIWHMKNFLYGMHPVVC
jgi:hypothetical protein